MDRTLDVIRHVSKFMTGDIVVAESGPWSKSPRVILDTHFFPDGTPAYRLRSCLPQYDDESGDEIRQWPKPDVYMDQKYVDTFKLLWRKGQ